MHLKYLIIKGFKSFAEKTVLKFKPGLTIVVGPNGSGKSNISDAVLWVFGEQSPRSLRGTVMEDVIFAGSSARPALGMTEVTLCLDNSDKSLPLEFSEVSITRRLLRSGESTYLINNSPCRLLDIQEILSDSGLGREGYSVIGQGRLEEILTSKPEEKRLFVEEAAGILKHKIRKERALKRLQSMEQTLFRIRDISQEVNRQLRPIKSQAEKAQEHRCLSGELETLELSQAVFELKELENQWKKLENEEEQLRKALESTKNELKQRENKLEEFQIQLEEKRLYTGNLSEQRRQLEGIQERLHSGLLLLEEKGKHQIEKISEMRQKTHQLEKEKAQINQEIEKIEGKGRELKNETKKVTDFLNQLSLLNKELNKRKENLGKNIENSKEEHAKNMSLLHENQKKLADLSRLIELNVAKLTLIEPEKNSKLAKIDEFEKLIKKEAIEKEKVEESTSKLKDEIKSLEEKKEETQNRVNEDEAKLIELKTRLAECSSKINTLKTLDTNLTGYPEAATWLLRNKNKPPGVIGCLIDLVKIPFRLEKAFEVALGQDLFCVLCETKEDAINALELVKKNTLLSGGIVFISLKNLPDLNNSSEKKDQKLSNYIEAAKKVKLAVDYLTKNVYLIDDKNKISITSDLTSVTTQGEMFSPYKIAYGTLSSQPSNVLARRRELSSLSKEENNLSNEILKFKEKIEKERLELASILENVTLSQKKLNEMLFKAQILEATLTTYQNEIIKQKESLTLIQEQSNELNKKIMSDKAAKESLLEDENNLKKIVSDNERELQTLKLEIEAIEKEELGFHREIIETETHLKSLKQQEIQLNQQIGKLNQELKEIKTLIGSEHKTCEGLESIVKRIQPTYELFFVLYEKGNWWATRLANAASGGENFFKEIRDSFKILQEEKIKLEDRKEKLTEDIRLKELKKVQLEGETTSAVEKIVEEYDTPLEKALEKYPIKISYAECEKKIGEIKHQLVQLGQINPMAIEEFKELDERQKFLNEQINDLMQSKKALEKVVRVINKKIEERFKETFVEVNNHFQAVFSYLFHGGKAEIILENEDNLLESGIEIQVQPQGKKLQKLSLLSGGETALAALAFLFAIYFTRPSPFYILDEVEASLDDINLKRFTNLLLKLKKEASFLIITHQQRTMEIADVIYGTTMQADGVSKLISQELKVEREAV